VEINVKISKHHRIRVDVYKHPGMK